MTDTQALDRLIEAVEAVEAGAMIPAINWSIFNWDDHAANSCGLIFKAHNGSFDAALALHAALLPGWDMNIDILWSKGGPRSSKVTLNRHGHVGKCVAHERRPAPALLLAILRAYRFTITEKADV